MGSLVAATLRQTRMRAGGRIKPRYDGQIRGPTAGYVMQIAEITGRKRNDLLAWRTLNIAPKNGWT